MTEGIGVKMRRSLVEFKFVNSGARPRVLRRNWGTLLSAVIKTHSSSWADERFLKAHALALTPEVLQYRPLESSNPRASLALATKP